MALPEDILGRFAVDDSYYRKSDNSVKHRAFMPKDGCTSVFLVSELTHAETVHVGALHVAPERGKPIRGYVKVEARHVINEALQVVDDDPPPKHANIIDWDNDIEAQKLKATIIAESAIFVLA